MAKKNDVMCPLQKSLHTPPPHMLLLRKKPLRQVQVWGILLFDKAALPDWFEEATDALKEMQEEEKRKEDQKWQKDREPYMKVN